jgi:signal recognition particle GTPase
LASAADVSTEATPQFSNSVQSGALNVEVPEDIAANKDLTTVKYDLLIKLAEKFKSQNWLTA